MEKNIDWNQLCNDFIDIYMAKNSGHISGKELEVAREVFKFLQEKI